MPNGDTLEAYLGWTHEKKRADYFGHPGYAANCQQEIDRMGAEHPDWVGQICDCQECVSNHFEG
jgi:hypothetical protein